MEACFEDNSRRLHEIERFPRGKLMNDQLIRKFGRGYVTIDHDDLHSGVKKIEMSADTQFGYLVFKVQHSPETCETDIIECVLKAIRKYRNVWHHVFYIDGSSYVASYDTISKGFPPSQ